MSKRANIQKQLTRNKMAESALNNERVTRDRVAALEARVTDLAGHVEALKAEREGLSRRGWAGFWRRLVWLNRGEA